MSLYSGPWVVCFFTAALWAQKPTVAQIKFLTHLIILKLASTSRFEPFRACLLCIPHEA